MDERLRFVARLLEGQRMSRVCREFGISRPTGYKIFKRYKDLGYEGLLDRSRRPYRHANRLPFQVERAIVGASCPLVSLPFPRSVYKAVYRLRLPAFGPMWTLHTG